jgi:hypothetical protein
MGLSDDPVEAQDAVLESIAESLKLGYPIDEYKILDFSRDLLHVASEIQSWLEQHGSTRKEACELVRAFGELLRSTFLEILETGK